ISGATVTLLRSADPDGPFIQVPAGSATMSPANRANPDLTDAAGRFGWDVIAGYYEVEASAPSCEPATSPVLTIPPPVSGLVIGLSCGRSGGAGGGGGRPATLQPPPIGLSPPPSRRHRHRRHHRRKCHGKAHGHGHGRKCGGHGTHHRG